MKPIWRMRPAVLLVALVLAACSGVSPGYSPASRGPEHSPDSEMPAFENRLETEHFVLRWTNKSRDPADNIPRPEIVQETGGYLEIAWSKYVELFGRTPYRAPGKDKIEVVFRDIDCYGVADPPDGPIQFSADAWMKNPGIRQPTSAHELFHKLQYAYGYKTKWYPAPPYMWFTEGTAAWAEVYVWGRVSRQCKVEKIFQNTKIDLYDADDMAMPFWIYFVSGNGETPNNQLMARLLERCEKLQDEKLAVKELVQETYGSADAYFASFAKERKDGFWADCCSAPYRCILGPDGKDVVDQIKTHQKKANQKS